MFLNAQGYWNGFYYPGYAWIIVDNFAQSDWWRIEDSEVADPINCTQSQLETALNYSVLVSPASVKSSNSYQAKVGLATLIFYSHQHWLEDSVRICLYAWIVAMGHSQQPANNQP